MAIEKIQTGLGISDVIGDKRAEVIQVAAKHGATEVRVFGSVARSEARPDSDVDLLVTWNYERLSAWGSALLWTELEALLDRKVDIVSADSLNWFIRDRVLQEAVPL